MKRIVSVITSAILAVSVSAGTLSTDTYADSDEPSAQSSSEIDLKYYIDQVSALINQFRAENGVGELRVAPILNEIAAKRAAELSVKFDHSRPDGNPCYSILDNYNIDFYSWGENIAMGFDTPEDVFEVWKNSEAHRLNMLKEKFNYIGIGIYEQDGLLYWEQILLGASEIEGAYVPELKTEQLAPGAHEDGSFTFASTDGQSYLTYSAEEIAASSEKPVMTVSTVDAVPGETVLLKINVDNCNWSSTGIHVNYDNSLELVEADYSDGVKDALAANTPVQYENGCFFATSGEKTTDSSEYAYLMLKVPDDAQTGDFYRVGIDYHNGDMFENNSSGDSGRLMTAYLFTNGIVNGGINVVSSEKIFYGDADESGELNIADAVSIISYIADSSRYPLSDMGIRNADVYNRGDGLSSADAVAVQYYLLSGDSPLPESFLK